MASKNGLFDVFISHVCVKGREDVMCIYSFNYIMCWFNKNNGYSF